MKKEVPDIWHEAENMCLKPEKESVTEQANQTTHGSSYPHLQLHQTAGKGAYWIFA